MEMHQSLRNDQRLMIHTLSDSAAECQAGRRPALTLAHLLGPGEKEEVILEASFRRKYDTDAAGPQPRVGLRVLQQSCSEKTGKTSIHIY